MMSEDAWIVIVGYIDHGSDYKSVCLVDKLRLSAAKMAHVDADTKFANHLTTLITMVDRGDYLPRGYATSKDFIAFITYCSLANPNITTNFIDAHRDWPWDWPSIGFNPNITIKWLESFDDDFHSKYNTWRQVSCHPCVTLDHMLATPGRYNWALFSRNPNATPAIINDHQELPWSWYEIVRNPSITWEFADRHRDGFVGHAWTISRYGKISIDNLKDSQDFPWDWYGLAANPHITFTEIMANRHLPWDMHWVSFNPSVTIDDVKNHPTIIWDWEGLSWNPNMTIKVVNDNPEYSWQTMGIYSNPGITWDVVEANPDGFNGIPWDIPQAGTMPGLTWKKIVELDRGGVTWDWDKIRHNTFGKK